MRKEGDKVFNGKLEGRTMQVIKAQDKIRISPEMVIRENIKVDRIIGGL